jgi:hypothetical protein
MIVCSTSNIDIIHGVVGYGNVSDGTTDWRITNTKTAIVGQTGIFSIFNSVTPTIPNISIIETGTVGIGTVPSISSTSKMEIQGSVNITGSYNINNRNVINDTSNYILSSSNAIVSRINAFGSDGYMTVSNNATSNTILSISNNNIVITFTAEFTGVGNTAPTTHAQVTDTPTDRYMIFTTASVNHTFTVPSGGLNCDILMIGGGGTGKTQGGGGAGACIVAINQTLPGGSCVVSVGNGSQSLNGDDSFIKVENLDRYRAKGGGVSSDTPNTTGTAGGCGGGAPINDDTTPESGGSTVITNVVNGSQANIGPTGSETTGLGYAVLGNAGGNNGTNNMSAGSGGGIGTVGLPGGKGGDGAYQVTISGTTYNFRSYFANGSTSFGVQDGLTTNYYIGGGGAGFQSGYQEGGLGGGANGSFSAIANTGSGGSGAQMSGGSGIIIIRYRLPSPIIGTPSIELIRGTAGDSNTDYKLGNYNGDFKVLSSISNNDTDRLNITSSGNIGIGITNPAVKLHVSGGDLACSGDIISYYSDERLKTKLSNIKEPLEIINNLNGFYYIPNDLARIHGITNTRTEVGLSAQEVQKVLPEIVKIAPFDLARDENDNNVSKSGENYLTLSYDRLAPIFVEAIKELSLANKVLNEKYNKLLEIISKNKE